jgi:hypothetical protein
MGLMSFDLSEVILQFLRRRKHCRASWVEIPISDYVWIFMNILRVFSTAGYDRR